MSKPTLSQAFSVWWRIGVLSFGGPAAQIALMHRMIVDERDWMSEKDFLSALSFCMLLPGPEAMQLATYSGWRLHGTLGGLIAGLLFVLPGAVVVLALSALYVLYGDVPTLEAAFLGIKAAVLIIVFEALLRVSGKGLRTTAHRIVAILAFIALFFFGLPFPLIILAAGVFGYVTAIAESDANAATVEVSALQTVKTIVLWLLVWIVPIAAIPWLTGSELFADLGIFFSKLATVTFGGAYAVLAYMAQDAVQTQRWLTTQEMMDGLGLAETTPGPLILVTEFVGFLAGARSGETVNLGMGVASAAVTLWATFAPCFLWVFAGAPYIEWLTSKPRLRSALAAISAAVVGVILNLSVWFAIHVLFRIVEPLNMGLLQFPLPRWSSIDFTIIALVALAALLLLWLHRSVLFTLAVCGAIAAILPALY